MAGTALAMPVEQGSKRHFRHHPECATERCAHWADVVWTRHHQSQRHDMSPSSDMPEAGASWFNDSGATKCETHYALGVANKYLACGTRVELCAQRCAVVTVEDRGPFVEGREWDLNVGAKEAIGFGDTGGVRWRVL